MNKYSMPLISTKELNSILGKDNVRILDASWYLPTIKRDAKREFAIKHIPTAQFFDIDEISDKTTDLPHMAAAASEFSSMVGDLGISHNDFIVIYDVEGLFSAARVWWNFKIMGAENVFILDGGLAKWLKDGYIVTDRTEKIKKANFIAKEKSGAIIKAENILQILESNFANGEQIIDLRSEERFLGKAKEPRANLLSGHIPNSINLPFTELVKNGRLIDEEKIRALLVTKNIDITKPIISTCGSAITAAILNLALARIGIDCLYLYDGSWAEWGRGGKFPVRTQS